MADAATVNGADALLRMSSGLKNWVDAELARKRLGGDWLHLATVSIRYSRITRSPNLTATALSERG